MADAPQRHAERRARQRQFHLNRVQRAGGLVEQLEAAFGLLRADLINTTDPAAAHKVATELVAHLLAQSERIPRSGI